MRPGDQRSNGAAGSCCRWIEGTGNGAESGTPVAAAQFCWSVLFWQTLRCGYRLVRWYVSVLVIERAIVIRVGCLDDCLLWKLSDRRSGCLLIRDCLPWMARLIGMKRRW